MESETNKKQRSCYFPIDIRIEKEYFQGFGAQELRRSVKGILGTIILAIVVFIISFNPMPTALILIGGIGGTIAVVQRTDATNICILDEINNIIRFKKMQKSYFYKFHNDFEVNGYGENR